jgi:hypothetical protein
MSVIKSRSVSDFVRRHAADTYVRPALRRGERVFTINVGEVHKSVALRNRVPLVCQALESDKFLKENALKLISKTGPPSGQSTTVTYTFQFIQTEHAVSLMKDPWLELRGSLKNVFADLGGGETYIGNERDNFYPRDSK